MEQGGTPIGGIDRSRSNHRRTTTPCTRNKFVYCGSIGPYRGVSMTFFIRALKRSERIVTEMNAWLLALSIGLATIDATVFVVLETESHMPLCQNCVAVTSEISPTVP